MADNPARIVGPTLLTTSSADLYTATSNGVLVREIIYANGSGASVTARLSLVPLGGSADGSNVIIPDVTIAAHDIFVFDCWQVLAAGDKLNGLASVGTSIIATVSGILL